MKPSLLLVADVKGWAFDNIAQNIMANLGEDYRISVCYMGDFTTCPWQFLIEHLIEASHDLIHFFWRDDLRMLIHPTHIYRAADDSGRPVEQVITALCRPAITTSVYDHLHLDDVALAERADTLHFAHGYSVSSPILQRLYGDTTRFPPPDAMIPDGVRLDFFTPGTGPATGVAGQDGPLVVGWVGNSRWGAHSHVDAKGLHTILKPAIEALQAEGIAIKPHFADIQEHRRSREEMADYYHEIDVLVCASLIEGTPNPVLEAMASGAAVISTDVGIVRKALGPLQARFILPERSPDCMMRALRELAADRGLLAQLKAENRQSIRDWDWAHTTWGWRGFWDRALTRAADPRLAHFRQAFLRTGCQNLAGGGANDTGAIAVWRPSLYRRGRQRAAEWLYARPRLARFVNKLRGRKT